jgi:hypothetical protein
MDEIVDVDPAILMGYDGGLYTRPEARRPVRIV